MTRAPMLTHSNRHTEWPKEQPTLDSAAETSTTNGTNQHLPTDRQASKKERKEVNVQRNHAVTHTYPRGGGTNTSTPDRRRHATVPCVQLIARYPRHRLHIDVLQWTSLGRGNTRSIDTALITGGRRRLIGHTGLIEEYPRYTVHLKVVVGNGVAWEHG